MKQINDKHVIAAIRSVLWEESLRHEREPEVIGELNFLKSTGYWPVPDEKLKAIYNATKNRLHITQHIYDNPKKAKKTGDILHNYDPDKVVDIATHLDMDSGNVLIYQLRTNWDVDRHDYKINSFNVRTDYDNKRYLNVVFQYDRYPTLKTAWLWDKDKEMKPDDIRYIKSKKERIEKTNAYTEYVKQLRQQAQNAQNQAAMNHKTNIKNMQNQNTKADHDNKATVTLTENDIRRMVSATVRNAMLGEGYLRDLLGSLKSMGNLATDATGVSGKIGEFERSHPTLAKIGKIFGLTPEADKEEANIRKLNASIVNYVSSRHGRKFEESFGLLYNSICEMINAPCEANGYQASSTNQNIAPSAFYNQCASLANTGVRLMEAWVPQCKGMFDEIEQVPDNNIYYGVSDSVKRQVQTRYAQAWNKTMSAFAEFNQTITQCHEEIVAKFRNFGGVRENVTMKVINKMVNQSARIYDLMTRIFNYWFVWRPEDSSASGQGGNTATTA